MIQLRWWKMVHASDSKIVLVRGVLLVKHVGRMTMEKNVLTILFWFLAKMKKAATLIATKCMAADVIPIPCTHLAAQQPIAP